MPVRTDRKGRHTVEFQLRGRRIHRRCPSGTTKAEAEALEAKLRHEIFATRDLGVEPTIDLPTAIAAWLREKVQGTKSERERSCHAFALVDYVEGKTLREIPAVADAYRADARAGRLAAATINNRLNVLKGTARLAWRKEWVRENLSLRISLEPNTNARHRYESHATLRKLVAAMPSSQGRAWIALAAGTGLRGGELHALQPHHARRGALYLGTSKNGEPRIVPVAKWALPYLKALPFTLNRWQLDREWRKARRAVGVKDFRFHDIRHSYASLLANKDVDMAIVGKLLGHRSANSTKRYAHLYESTLRAAVRKLG